MNLNKLSIASSKNLVSPNFISTQDKLNYRIGEFDKNILPRDLNTCADKMIFFKRTNIASILSTI